MPDSVDAALAVLAAERKRLDQLLDDALEQFALYEEEMNKRMKAAAPDQDQFNALMAERSQMEDTLGIADLVDQIDAVRAQVAQLKAGSAA